MGKKRNSFFIIILFIIGIFIMKPMGNVEAATNIFSNYSVFPANYYSYTDESKIPANVSVYEPVKITFNDINSGLAILDSSKITVSSIGASLDFNKTVVGNSILLTPKTVLAYNTVYDITFTIGAGAISYSGTSNSTDIIVPHVKFKTEYSLNNLITTNGIDTLLKSKLPKDLNIYIEQYILSITVTNTNVNSSNFTSIDINNHSDVAEVDVNDRLAQIPSNNSKIFNVGFYGLTDGSDIKISVKDYGGREFESKTVKFNASKSKDVTTIKDASTHGKPYTLQDLINNKTLFQTVLDNSKAGSNTSLRENISFENVGIDIKSGAILNTTTDMEYSLTSSTGTTGSFLPCKEGSTTGITFTPGKSVCIRDRNNYSNFVLVPVSKDVAAAPKFTIDYANKTTVETVPVSMEYAEDAAFSINRNDGTGSVVNLTPDKTYYFRIKATSDTVSGQAFKLVVPVLPKTPVININYDTLTTKESIPSAIEYSQDSSFVTGVNIGSGVQVHLTQGNTYYFRYKAVYGKSFASDFLKVDVTDSTNKPAAPSYSIDYLNETTKESIPSTVEYVEYVKGKTTPNTPADADFTGSLLGSGKTITLNEGSTYYFRVKSTVSSFAGNVFSLSVPNRQTAPSFSIDFINESINIGGLTSTDYEYSFDNFKTTYTDCSAVNSLKGKYGTTLYVRKKAIVDISYKSQIQQILIPKIQLTNYTIDYSKGAIAVPVGEDVEYSYNQDMSSSNIVNGGSLLGLNPGTTIKYIYIRTKASNTAGFFTKDIQKIMIPARPVAIKYTVNYLSGTTSQVVSTSMEYLESNSKITDGDDWDNTLYFNKYSFNPGQGKTITISPGKYYYFRTKGTNKSFPGYISEIDLSSVSTPTSPNYTINYITETTNELVPATVEYAEDANFTINKKSGAGQKVALTPGKTYYFRTKGTSTTLAGVVYPLVVKPRQPIPTFTIDYTNEQLNKAIDNTYEYSFDNFKSTISGAGNNISLNPGDSDKNLFIRLKGTETDFSGEIQNILIPGRPKTNFTINFTTEYTNEAVTSNVEWADNEAFINSSTGDGNPMNLTPSDKDKYIYFRVKAGNGNFVGTTQTLKIPARPVTPTFTIDAKNITTQIVGTNIEYCISDSSSSNFTPGNILCGRGQTIDFTPYKGKTIYFRIKGSNTSFVGNETSLTVNP